MYDFLNEQSFVPVTPWNWNHNQSLIPLANT